MALVSMRKKKPRRILVVVVKWRHSENGLFKVKNYLEHWMPVSISDPDTLRYFSNPLGFQVRNFLV